MDPLSAVLLGMVSMGSLTAGVFFLRFWRDTRDRLFLAFGVAFTVEGLNRVALALTPDPSEAHPAFYLVRLAAYATILIGIVDKNRSRR